jgi:hypothetical protein
MDVESSRFRKGKEEGRRAGRQAGRKGMGKLNILVGDCGELCMYVDGSNAQKQKNMYK